MTVEVANKVSTATKSVNITVTEGVNFIFQMPLFITLYSSFNNNINDDDNDDDDKMMMMMMMTMMMVMMVSPKACEGTPGRHMTSDYMTTTPVVISCESILRWEENQSAERKTIGVMLRC